MDTSTFGSVNVMKPGQNDPLPFRSRRFRKLPINQGNVGGIQHRRDRSSLTFGGFEIPPASTDKAVQKLSAQIPINYAPAPMMRVPTEIRRRIFGYLLPEKTKPIEPSSVVRERKVAEEKQDDSFLSRVQERARVQHRDADNLRKHSAFFGKYDLAIHSARIFETPFSTNHEIPMDFSVGSFGDVYAMAKAKGSDYNEIIWSPATASTPALATEEIPDAKLQERFGPIIWSAASTASRSSTIFTDSPTEEEKAEINAAIHAEQYDPVPVDMTLNVLTTCSLFATEISTMLFDEYTFEIHVHFDGVELLHLPRIATYEYYGTELAQKMAMFQEQGHFCLKRMRHLSFVLFGCDTGSRTATWRLRKNVEGLMGMVGELASLEVKFAGEDDFWTVNDKDAQRARMGSGDVSVVEMVCAPFAAGLPGVGRVGVELPRKLKEDEGLLGWQEWFKGRAVGNEKMTKDNMCEMKEATMFQATLDFEYRQAFGEGNHMEGYAWLDGMDMNMDVDVDVGEESEAEGHNMEYESDTTEEMPRSAEDGFSRWDGKVLLR